MQLFLIMAVALAMSIFGYNEFNRYSYTSSGDIQKHVGDAAAGNLYLYNDNAVEYLLTNYSTFFDASPVTVNGVYYKPTNNFNNDTLKPYYQNRFTFNQRKIEYSSTYFLYINSTESNPIPVMYYLNTWSQPNKEAISTFGGLNKLLTDRSQTGDNTYWVSGMFGSYSNGNVKLYSKIPLTPSGNTTGNVAQQIDAATTKIQTVLNILNTQGFKLQEYFFLMPVYQSN